MPSFIDLPEELLKATAIAWTMEANHALVASPFSGFVQAQRGTMERWSFVMTIRKLTRQEAQIAQGFFLMLEGPLGLFRMHDPAQCLPLGRASGVPKLSAAAASGARTISTDGWTANTPGVLKAGDWIQIGDQLTKVRADVNSSATGTATISIWPKVMVALADNTDVITRYPKGLFRFTSEAPAWEVVAGMKRNYELKLTGVQEVLQPDA